MAINLDELGEARDKYLAELDQEEELEAAYKYAQENMTKFSTPHEDPRRTEYVVNLEREVEFLREEVARHLAHLDDYRPRCEAIAIERDDARNEVAQLRGVLAGYEARAQKLLTNLYLPPSEDKEASLNHLTKSLTDRLRPSVEASEVRGARWMQEWYERHGLRHHGANAAQVCLDARGSDHKQDV
jgi:chromosome segregation ATPase